ncbi:Zn-ribbon domain-containing OB-fold protein [Hydrogenophaga sp.]|uniref:Zn-ribbon domain-containing OB-fold protein n=1 Tax=Hydrogenophaga sp. TaxID=1904254 RepID=UPI002FC67732
MSASGNPVFDGCGPDALFAQGLAQGRFQIQRCSACRQHVFYPRALCTHCGSAQLEWVHPSGIGSVYSSTIVRRKPQAGGDYNVALVDLAEGPRLMSRIDGIAPDQVHIGMRVQARVIDDPAKGKLLVFMPEGATP